MKKSNNNGVKKKKKKIIYRKKEHDTERSEDEIEAESEQLTLFFSQAELLNW